MHRALSGHVRALRNASLKPARALVSRGQHWEQGLGWAFPSAVPGAPQVCASGPAHQCVVDDELQS